MSEETKETKDKSEVLSLDSGNLYISMNKNRDIGKHKGSEDKSCLGYASF